MCVIKDRMKLVLTPEDLERIEIEEKGDRRSVSVDVHKLHRVEAVRLVNNVIALTNSKFDLTVIHGYNRGTVVRDIVRGERFLKSKRLKNGFRKDFRNPGVTMFCVDAV